MALVTEQGAVLTLDSPAENVEVTCHDIAPEKLGEHAAALGKPPPQTQVDDAAPHPPPIAHRVAPDETGVPRAAENPTHEPRVERAPVPDRNGEKLEATAGHEVESLDVARAPSSGGATVTDDARAPRGELIEGIVITAAPPQKNPRGGIGELDAKSERIKLADRRRLGTVGDEPHVGRARNCPGDGTGDEVRLEHPPVEGADPGRRGERRAVEDLNARMVGGNPTAGPNERGRRRDDDVGAVLGCTLHRVLGGLPRTRCVRGGRDLTRKGLLQILPAVLVSLEPRASRGLGLVGEGDAKRSVRDDRVNDARHDGEAGARWLRAHGHVRSGRRRGDVRRHASDRRLELLLAHRPERRHGIGREPGEKGLGGGDSLGFLLQRGKRRAEPMEGSREDLALVIRPHVIRLEPERLLKPSVSPLVSKTDEIGPAQRIEAQELSIDAECLVIRPRGKDTRDGAGHGRGTEALEDAHALVALLNVEAPQILVDLDRVADALVAQVRLAE